MRIRTTPIKNGRLFYVNPGGILKAQIQAEMAEAENQNRSQSIIWGIKTQAENGTSNLYSRKCYGYNSSDGTLIVNPEEAKNVRLIFDLYLKGYIIVKIVNELFSRKIPSPTGKERWCKRSIDTMLSNEKYTGDIVVLKTYSSGYPNNRRIKNTNTDEQHPMYIAKNAHEPIIPFEMYHFDYKSFLWVSLTVIIRTVVFFGKFTPILRQTP